MLPDVCVQEVGSAHVVVLFATASTVFRLVLPHPCRGNHQGRCYMYHNIDLMQLMLILYITINMKRMVNRKLDSMPPF